MDMDRESPTIRRPEIQLSPLTPQRLPPPVLKNFDSVRRNIQLYSSGIFDVSCQSQRDSPQSHTASPLPDLPPRADFANLSRSYLASLHDHFPILHWPTFQHEVDQAYTTRSFHGIAREWVGLFFAVLACGSLHSSNLQVGLHKIPDRGKEYFEISTGMMDAFSQNVTTTHVRVALLLSIFAAESNMGWAGSTWLANATRMAQILGLHLEMDGPAIDGEMRRRLWWSIYTLDR
jgi:hypothetical protein